MSLKEGLHQNFIFSLTKRVELTDIALHICLGLSCFFHMPEKIRDKMRAKTYVGENIVKILVLEVKVLVPRCGSTGPWICQIGSRNVFGKVRNIFEKNESSRLIV